MKSKNVIHSILSGLDPAGPNFDSPECDADPETCRLHPSDATQVQRLTSVFLIILSTFCIRNKEKN